MSNVLVVYNPATGAIQRTVNGGDVSDPTKLVTPAETWLVTTETTPMSITAGTHKVENGEVVPIPGDPLAWEGVRGMRDRLLRASDWRMLPDAPGGNLDAWVAYRQALRDVTNQPDPNVIVWPTPPPG